MSAPDPVEADGPVDRAGEPSRRAALQGLGITLVAGAGGFATFTAYGPRTDPSRTGGPAIGYAPRFGGDTPAAGSRAVLAPLADVPASGGLVLADQQVVLIRDSGSTVHAFSAVCTHQGCLVSEVREGLITCPCHGSAFDAATGAVASGPATTPLPAVAVTVAGGNVLRGTS